MAARAFLCIALLTACQPVPRPGTFAEGMTEAQSICLILFAYVETACAEPVEVQEEQAP